ncbi:MAG: hypothetical protein JO022_18200 [Acidobacteriaceae bacterium]|nr:hypothetical protein [Acidobacteriaceae bacterium]
MRSILVAACGLLACACHRLPETYAPPEQRHPFEGPSLGRASMMVNMNDEDAVSHIVKDISHQLEGGSWRWCEKRPTVKILLIKTRGLKFTTDFTIWKGCLEQTGPQTVSFFVGDRVLGRVRYDTPGYKHFEKPVDAAWLQTAQDTVIAEEVDKVYVDPKDGTKLGFILTNVGFVRQ